MTGFLFRGARRVARSVALRVACLVRGSMPFALWLLLGPAWIAWYARSLAPRLTFDVGPSFPDPLAGGRPRANLA